MVGDFIAWHPHCRRPPGTPPTWGESRTVFLPKGSSPDDRPELAERWRPAGDTRPITLKNADAKLTASTVGHPLGRIHARRAAEAQRGSSRACASVLLLDATARALSLAAHHAPWPPPAGTPDHDAPRPDANNASIPRLQGHSGEPCSGATRTPPTPAGRATSARRARTSDTPHPSTPPNDPSASPDTVAATHSASYNGKTIPTPRARRAVPDGPTPPPLGKGQRLTAPTTRTVHSYPPDSVGGELAGAQAHSHDGGQPAWGTLHPSPSVRHPPRHRPPPERAEERRDRLRPLSIGRSDAATPKDTCSRTAAPRAHNAPRPTRP